MNQDATAGDDVLELRDITVEFEMDRGTSRVVDGVSLDVRRDEVLGIVGESGSGKSMLAEAILDAVVEPGTLTGEVVYHPRDGPPVEVVSLAESEKASIRWREISMVFQGAMSSFNPTLKIRGHFAETLRAHGVDVDEGLERARRLLADLYLDPERVLDSYPHELSGGMKQRALIALSLVLEPDVLVMDEPTSALDLLMQRSIVSLLRDLKAEYDLTLVFITHDLPLVATLADRLAVMYAFDLVEYGPTEEILERAAHPYTRALLRATPDLDVPTTEMRSIEGSSPDPVNVPAGCSYHPRCPMATEQCEREEPPLEPVADGHESACFYRDDVEATIPLSAPGEGTR